MKVQFHLDHYQLPRQSVPLRNYAQSSSIDFASRSTLVTRTPRDKRRRRTMIIRTTRLCRTDRVDISCPSGDAFNYMNNEARARLTFSSRERKTRDPLQELLSQCATSTTTATITIITTTTTQSQCECGWNGNATVGLDSSRSEMALLPRRCPRLLLIQIPTSSVLGPFCIFLRSLPALVRSSLRSSWSPGERAPHCLSYSPRGAVPLAREYARASLSPSRSFFLFLSRYGGMV